MDLTNLEMCMVSNYEKAHDPVWLFQLLQEKIHFLDDQLSARHRNGMEMERSVIQRLEDYKTLANNLKPHSMHAETLVTKL